MIWTVNLAAHREKKMADKKITLHIPEDVGFTLLSFLWSARKDQQVIIRNMKKTLYETAGDDRKKAELLIKGRRELIDKFEDAMNQINSQIGR